MGKVVLLGIAAASGCAGNTDMPIDVSAEALTVSSRVLGFENTADWRASTGTLAASAVHDEGAAAIAVSSFWYTEITSVRIGSVGAVGSTVALDVTVPAGQAWGSIKLIFDSPQAGLYYAIVGETPLGGLPARQFVSLTYALSNDVANRLRGRYSDLTVKIAINGTQSASSFIVDNLRFPGAATDGGVDGGTGGSGGGNSFCVDPQVLNGGFETGSAGTPDDWLANMTPGVQYQWEESGGIDGSRCISMTNTTSSSLWGVWEQPVLLQPYAPYVLHGWMRFEGPRDLPSAFPNIADIAAADYGYIYVGPETAANAGTTWTEFAIDFETGYEPHINVRARLHGGGKVFFDDISIQCNRQTQRFQSDHFILDLYPAKVAAATPAAVTAVVARTEKGIKALAELTGQSTLFSTTKQIGWSPDWVTGAGVAGYPFLWQSDATWMATNWHLADYLPEIFAHEIGHNYDSAHWDFTGDELVHNAEFNEFKAYYIYETLNYAIAEGGYARGADTRRRPKAVYDDKWGNQRCMGQEALIYKSILIRDQIGWEPFRQTYRDLLAMPDATVPATAWGRIQLWYDKLARYSGKDVWGMFTPEERAAMQTLYTRPKNGTPVELAALPSTTKELWLSDARWDSATVGWLSPSANYLPDGCPFVSLEREYDKGLFAHAPSDYVFTLNGQWQTLATDYALQRSAGGAVSFEIWGDGRRLFISDDISDSQARSTRVSVAGVNTLSLRTGDLGDGSSDWALWLGTKLSR
jgi:hypothetical protein